ncbi:MAG: hypothetical protein J6Q07_00025 [Alistipes sp.]|nr:hypothetical protein [Alistipes sp.]
MVYVIYNTPNDINDFWSDSKESVLIRAGELIDRGVDADYQVLKYDTTYDDYMDALDVDSYLSGTYSLKGFVNQFGAGPDFNTITPAEAERLINLAPEEKAFVVMHIEDSTLLAELSRRMSEYRKYADKILTANDELRIFV